MLAWDASSDYDNGASIRILHGNELRKLEKKIEKKIEVVKWFVCESWERERGRNSGSLLWYLHCSRAPLYLFYFYFYFYYLLLLLFYFSIPFSLFQGEIHRPWGVKTYLRKSTSCVWLSNLVLESCSVRWIFDIQFEIFYMIILIFNKKIIDSDLRDDLAVDSVLKRSHNF